jgi:hypothetical protein
LNNLFDTKVFSFPAIKEDEFTTTIPYAIEKEYIPKDPHEFYCDFGFLQHSRTGQLIERLTPYQYSIWSCPAKTVLVDKSQKSGITTSELLHDFQESLINGKGKDLLIIGQTAKHAEEHLYTLKRLIVESEKYRKYLITKSSELYFREEQTKVRTLFLKNPDNPYRPMRIIGLPFTLSSIWSWKNVFRIHVSDPAAAPIIDDAPVYAAAFSRLTNTDGRMMIEGPPAGPYGRFYELHEQFKDNKNPDFQVFHVDIYNARDNGLVTQEFIDEKKIELGPLFAQTYEGSFDVGVGNVFDPLDIDKSIALGNELESIPMSQYTLKVCACDPGFGSSPFGLVVCELLKDKQKVVVRQTETFTKSDPNMIKDFIFDLYRKWWNLWIVVDGSNRAFVNLLKSSMNERLDWDAKKVSPNSMKVVPVSFNKDHEEMLQKLVIMMNKNYLAIPSKHSDLIRGLRTAQAIGYKLQKDRMINSDLVDALRLSLKGINIK